MNAGLLLRLLLLVLLMLILLFPLLLAAFPVPSKSSFLSGIRVVEFSKILSLFLDPYGRPGGLDTGGGGER